MSESARSVNTVLQNESMCDASKENSLPVIVFQNNVNEYSNVRDLSTVTNDDLSSNSFGSSQIQYLNISDHSEHLHDSFEVLEDITNKRFSNIIYQILQKTYEGNFQLASYDFELVEENKSKLLETKKTTYFSKNKVAKLIVNHEFYRCNNFHISPERFIELAKSAAELFPTLIAESFYTKSTPIKSAGGVFQVYYGKQREKEFAIERLKRPNKRKTCEIDFCESENLKILREKVNIIDTDYVILWTKTAASEKYDLYMHRQLKDVIEVLPNLAHPLGYLLIEADFNEQFNKASDLFEKSFSSVAQKLINVAKSKKSDVEIKEILSANGSIIGEEHRRTVALMLLPHLFKRTAKITARSKTKTNWTPSKSEISSCFVTHVKTTERLQESLKEVQSNILNLYNDHKLIVRPYVVINGPSLSEIKTAFVIAGPITFQLPSTSAAVNICFQLMKVLNEPYSCVCNHLWQFLEKRVYQFEVKNLYAGVVSLIEKTN